jgi:2,3-dihydroxybenzoate decarboxylase
VARERENALAVCRKIALEEHFLCPAMEDYWKTTVADVDPQILAKIVGRLSDFGEQRLAAMDAAGIVRAVLSLSGPGVQVERDTATAIRNAKSANDFLAHEIQKNSARYSGFAHLPMQDPGAAADELSRCVNDLKFSGAMINGHTNGQYLDDRALDPFWARAEELGALIYLHPADPPAPMPVLEGVKALKRATWEWGVETGSHALRLIFGGVFDRFPGARLALGHLGEALPFLLWRFDSRAKLYGVKLARSPSDYVRQNIVVTTSGMFSAEPLHCTITALGADRVMFSADYPFESVEEASAFMDTVPLSDSVRQQISFGNAEKILGLAHS